MKNYFSLLPFWLSDLHRTTYCLSVMGFLLTTLLFVTKLHSLSGRRMFFEKKGGQGGFEPPTSRTQSENHTPRPLALNGELNLEGFEPPTFGSGIRRATIAP